MCCTAADDGVPLTVYLQRVKWGLIHSESRSRLGPDSWGTIRLPQHREQLVTKWIVHLDVKGRKELGLTMCCTAHRGLYILFLL